MQGVLHRVTVGPWTSATTLRSRSRFRGFLDHGGTSHRHGRLDRLRQRGRSRLGLRPGPRRTNTAASASPSCSWHGSGWTRPRCERCRLAGSRRSPTSPIAEEIRAKMNQPLRPGVEPVGGERRPPWKPREIISPTPHLPHLAVPKGTKPDRFRRGRRAVWRAGQAQPPPSGRRPSGVASLWRQCIGGSRRHGAALPAAGRGRRG